MRVAPSSAIYMSNLDERTVQSFGREWSRFDQSEVQEAELSSIFEQYFRLFPWQRIPPEAKGFDAGCGSGRWARFVAPRVGVLNCVDASPEALEVAKRNLQPFKNSVFHQCSVMNLPFAENSMDFGYSLGVLHHVPDTEASLAACARVLKKGAPFLVYLYYAMDNRPWWFRSLWRASNGIRHLVAALPEKPKNIVCDTIALTVYWPLARFAKAAEFFGGRVSNFPLASYRNRSLYTMRTDSRDRFGTPLEQRFSASQIREMMEAAGLTEVRLADTEPYWCAVGFKA